MNPVSLIYLLPGGGENLNPPNSHLRTIGMIRGSEGPREIEEVRSEKRKKGNFCSPTPAAAAMRGRMVREEGRQSRSFMPSFRQESAGALLSLSESPDHPHPSFSSLSLNLAASRFAAIFQQLSSSSSNNNKVQLAIKRGTMANSSSLMSLSSSSSSNHHHNHSHHGPQQSRDNQSVILKASFPEDEMIEEWLKSIDFIEYLHHFIDSGYDMPTISKMTPEDLIGIGIQNPTHRRILKTEIQRLIVPTNDVSSPSCDFTGSNSLYDWLYSLRLEEYHRMLCKQGYDTILKVANGITWEDFEDVGIRKLGHQKRLSLAIKKFNQANPHLKVSQNGPPTPSHKASVERRMTMSMSSCGSIYGTLTGSQHTLNSQISVDSNQFQLLQSHHVVPAASSPAPSMSSSSSGGMPPPPPAPNDSIMMPPGHPHAAAGSAVSSNGQRPASFWSSTSSSSHYSSSSSGICASGSYQDINCAGAECSSSTSSSSSIMSNHNRPGSLHINNSGLISSSSSSGHVMVTGNHRHLHPSSASSSSPYHPSHDPHHSQQFSSSSHNPHPQMFNPNQANGGNNGHVTLIPVQSHQHQQQHLTSSSNISFQQTAGHSSVGQVAPGVPCCRVEPLLINPSSSHHNDSQSSPSVGLNNGSSTHSMAGVNPIQKAGIKQMELSSSCGGSNFMIPDYNQMASQSYIIQQNPPSPVHHEYYSKQMPYPNQCQENQQLQQLSLNPQLNYNHDPNQHQEVVAIYTNMNGSHGGFIKNNCSPRNPAMSDHMTMKSVPYDDHNQVQMMAQLNLHNHQQQQLNHNQSNHQHNEYNQSLSTFQSPTNESTSIYATLRKHKNFSNNQPMNGPNLINSPIKKVPPPPPKRSMTSNSISSANKWPSIHELQPNQRSCSSSGINSNFHLNGTSSYHNGGNNREFSSGGWNGQMPSKIASWSSMDQYDDHYEIYANYNHNHHNTSAPANNQSAGHQNQMKSSSNHHLHHQPPIIMQKQQHQGPGNNHILRKNSRAASDLLSSGSVSASSRVNQRSEQSILDAMHDQAFATCVKSLASRFSRLRAAADSNCVTPTQAASSTSGKVAPVMSPVSVVPPTLPANHSIITSCNSGPVKSCSPTQSSLSSYSSSSSSTSTNSSGGVNNPAPGNQVSKKMKNDSDDGGSQSASKINGNREEDSISYSSFHSAPDSSATDVVLRGRSNSYHENHHHHHQSLPPLPPVRVTSGLTNSLAAGPEVTSSNESFPPPPSPLLSAKKDHHANHDESSSSSNEHLDQANKLLPHDLNGIKSGIKQHQSGSPEGKPVYQDNKLVPGQYFNQNYQTLPRKSSGSNSLRKCLFSNSSQTNGQIYGLHESCVKSTVNDLTSPSDESSSSAASSPDSIPFANDNIGTIKPKFTSGSHSNLSVITIPANNGSRQASSSVSTARLSTFSPDHDNQAGRFNGGSNQVGVGAAQDLPAASSCLATSSSGGTGNIKMMKSKKLVPASAPASTATSPIASSHPRGDDGTTSILYRDSTSFNHQENGPHGADQMSSSKNHPLKTSSNGKPPVPPHPNQHHRQSSPPSSLPLKNVLNDVPSSSGAKSSSINKNNVVIEDIETMLANLSSQLDAMLEDPFP